MILAAHGNRPTRFKLKIIKKTQVINQANPGTFCVFVFLTKLMLKETTRPIAILRRVDSINRKGTIKKLIEYVTAQNKKGEN